MSKTFAITFFLGLLFLAANSQLTSLQIREGSKDEKVAHNVTVSLTNENKDILIQVTSDADGEKREPDVRLRRLLDTQSVGYRSDFLKKGEVPKENPKGVVSQYTLTIANLKNETTACASLPVPPTEKDVKELYYCHLEVRTYSQSNYLFTILEIKVLDGAKGKTVRHIPVYDRPTDRLATGGYAVIQEKYTRFTFDLNDKCSYPANNSIPDNSNLKLLGKQYYSGADVDWFNNSIKNATHVKLVQVECAGNFSKWTKTNFKLNGMTAAPGLGSATDKSFCINMDFPFWKLQDQLQRRGFNCTPATLRIVLGDEKETFLFPPIRVTLSNVYTTPKQAKLCGFMCVVMIGAGGTFAVLLIIFLILYFRNKNKQQSYEESLAKPLTSGQSPYYELPQS